jgi:AcrR family transcriptional regulator
MDRRRALTLAALQWCLVHGIQGLSLRPLAESIGTSARMLVYHFGSREGLVDAVLAEFHATLAADLAAMPVDHPAGPIPVLRVLWYEHLRAPDRASSHTLAMELWTASVLGASAELMPWARQTVDLFHGALVRLLTPHTERAVEWACLVQAVTDGLLLRQRVAPDTPIDDAFEVLLEALEGELGGG